jgi:hypothetical protein
MKPGDRPGLTAKTTRPRAHGPDSVRDRSAIGLKNLRRRLDCGGNVAGEAATLDNLACVSMIEDRRS